MAIFRGVGGSGDSSDNSYLQEVTAQANSASASATSAANSLAAIQDTEITSASFDTSDGVLTLTKTGGATVTADLDGRFLTSYTETNDLSTAVTWANVPDANITQSSVTQHQAALSITESQISDLQSYLTAETNDLSTTVTWANVPDANITQSSVTQHQAALSITESQISDLQSYLTSFDITTQTDPKYLRADADDTTTGTITADGGFSTSTGNFVTLSGSISTNSGSINANSGNITTSGNIIVGGTVDGVDIAGLETTVTGKADLSGATFTGDISAPNLNISKTGSVTTNIATGTGGSGNTKTVNIGTGYGTGGTTTVNIAPTSTTTTKQINLNGNVAVTGTVDGRDVAADGATLDAIPYHRVKQMRISGTNAPPFGLTTLDIDLGQYRNLYSESTPVPTTRYLDVEWFTDWVYASSNPNDIRLTLRLTVPSGATTETLGTVTEVSSSTYYTTRQTGEQWYSVAGDKTHLFTDFGRVSQVSTGGAVEHIVRASQYNPANNKTYFCTTTALAAMSTGDTAYWHPYAWESAGTVLTDSREFTERYMTGSERQNISFALAYTDTALTFNLKVREVTTGDYASVRDAQIKLTSVGL